MPPKTKITRCGWCGSDPLYVQYHDREWGIPVHDDRLLFEFLVLESMQAGLSWLTILRKRQSFREAFDGFDFRKIARYNLRKVTMLMRNKGIIRNRQKIRAVINNARAFLAVREEFGTFDRYIWSFVGRKPLVNLPRRLADIPTRTALSDEISKDLKRRGFSFVGSTICYAHMQATGMVNDHLVSCFRVAQK